ncbi:zonular occludens toxin domain-containing protein [Vibrio mimicus]|uniref:zonular occludens toxin domain-containing protein n=1 Tax=Vibrio mimicus TaxID=674 RepID=UPI0004E3F3BA|nr:zonular occludens toxin domain-containing protein [Vibrio mimicus]KFE30597.1 zonular occludens toxin family protein [Vibrio mimicus]
MSCYFVYGTLGAGKGIFLARKMKEYLARGSRVATNVDLFPDKLCPNTVEPISRLPSVFRLEDLDQLGRGCPEEEKTKLGGLFLDEGAVWLNSRTWNEKGRKELIDKLLMIRKLGWDIFIAIQDPESTDKQALGALGEHFICCTRLDHFRVPLLSSILDFYVLCKTRGKQQHFNLLPHINKASYRRGIQKQGNKPYNSETYRPSDYFGMYDTNQIFEVDQEFLAGRLVDMRAPFTYVPGKTQKQWYSPPEPLPEQKTKAKTKFPWLSLFLFFFFLLGAVFFLSIAFSSEPDSPKTKTSPDAQQTNLPAVPDYLQGLYISGYLLIKRGDKLTYDYAIHDRFHRSFDVSHFAVRVTPAAPCLAWLTTVDNVNVQITCQIVPYEEIQKSQPVLADFSLTDVAKATIEATQ